jgi:hypothetical protein
MVIVRWLIIAIEDAEPVIDGRLLGTRPAPCVTTFKTCPAQLL